MAADRGRFGRLGFIMAAVGSAIGLGNIWKFPYITYANNGGSFVLIYLVAVLLIGTPIMLAEILIGRHTQQSPVAAFRDMASQVAGGRLWSLLGGLGVFTGFVLLSYYSIIAGWTIFYFGRCFLWSLHGYALDGPALGAYFGNFLANGPLQLTFHAAFMALTIAIVIFGVKSGIERVAKVLMPLLGIMLLGLALNSIRTPGFNDAIHFLFHIGPIEADAVLEAVGHAFFTLSLGMGAMITYGSYVSREDSIPRAGIIIVFFDTLVALLACIIMFSIIFGVPEAERAATFTRSSTILFTTLPGLFYELPFGHFLSPLFYVLVAFAALTSTISLLEVAVSYFIDVWEWSRKKATLSSGVAIFVMGIPAAYSLGANKKLSEWNIFGKYDYTVSNWFLPIGGLLIALYAGWFLKTALTRDELEHGHGRFTLYPVWLFLLRFVSPIAICWILWAVIRGRSF